MMVDESLPSPWLVLHQARTRRKALRQELDDLKSSCLSQHGTKHVVECSSCLPKVLEAMQSQHFGEPQDIIAQNSGLEDGLMADWELVKQGEKPLSALANQPTLTRGKEDWYRSMVSEILDLVAVEKNYNRDGVLEALKDSTIGPDQMSSMMWTMLGNPPNWSQDVEGLVEKITELPEDSSKRAECPIRAYRDANTNGHLAVARDLQKSKPTYSQRVTLQKRLDELSRGKTAFEQDKSEQVKGQVTGSTKVVAGRDLDVLPACYACQKEVDKKDVFSCTVCQVALQMADSEGKAGRELTLYCSEGCFRDGYHKHMDTNHECAARDSCASEVLDDGDEAMADADGPQPVVCKDCLERKSLTVFCTENCAKANIGGHWTEAHEVKSDDDDTDGLVISLADVTRKVIEQANPGLTFSWLK